MLDRVKVMDKRFKIVAAVIAIGLVVLGLLYYYQSQGLIDIFPTAEDKRIEQILKIDETKFAWPEGLTQEQYDKKLVEIIEEKKKLEDNPTDPTTWVKFGNGLEFLNAHEQAIEAWKQALTLQPQNFLAAGNIATTYQYFIRDFKNAEFYYYKALEAMPDLTLAFQGLTDIYRYNMKDLDKLEQIMQVAINNDPTNASVYLSALVEAYADEGDSVKAKEYLARVKEINQQAAAELVEHYPGALK